LLDHLAAQTARFALPGEVLGASVELQDQANVKEIMTTPTSVASTATISQA